MAIGGSLSVDLVPIEENSLAHALRHGGVVPGTEVVSLGVRQLKKGIDYGIDYGAGTIFLMIPAKPGESLRVQYRYDPSKPQTSSQSSNGAPGFQFSVLPGATMMLNFGVTERLADGTVLQSSSYGLKTNFSFAGGAMKGLFVLGERKKAQARSAYETESAKAEVETGKSQAILQDWNGNVFGGKFQLNYQDITKNFTAFGNFHGAGYEKSIVDQLQKEKGLKRTSYSLQNIGGKSLNLSSSYKQIQDQGASLEWRSYGVEAGPVKLNYSSQRVDPQFSRFQDIAEADRDQLAKEKGLTRELLDGSLTLKGGSGFFKSLKVEDLEGTGIFRRSLGYEGKSLKFSLLDQHVETGFTKFASLREADRDQLAREAGMRRQKFSIEATPFAFLTPLQLHQNVIRTDAGSLKDIGFQLGGNRWNFQHSLLDIDPGFANLQNLPESELQSHLQKIGRMYESKDGVVRPEEKAQLFRSTGIERTSSQLKADFGKGYCFFGDALLLRGAKDSGTVQRLQIQTPGLTIAYRGQDFGDELTDLGNLLEFERQRVGVLPGLQRADLSVVANLSKDRTLSFNNMRAGAGTGEAWRQALGYKDSNLELNYVRRFVPKEFTQVNQLIDPEKDLFATMLGFARTDVTLKWTPYRGLSLQTQYYSAESDTLSQTKLFANTILGWSIDRNTNLTVLRFTEKNDDPTQALVNNRQDLLTLTRNFGRGTKFEFQQETKTFDGIQSTLPDSKRDTVAFETKLTDKTAIRTEQTRTNYEDGHSETVSANTLSAELNKRTGVSITDTRITRDGDRPDENKRNYGFWWDFGKGLVLKYGYARNLNSNDNGDLKSDVQITPGQIGGIKVDSATYQTLRKDESRDAHVGNIQFGSAKPFDLGFLKDFAFRFAADTARDNGIWGKENRNFWMSGRIGSNIYKYEYLGQVDQSGYRAIDRIFSFATDQSENRPFRASVLYKLRTLPNDSQVMIRNYNFSWKPTNGLELSHSLQTNLDTPQGGVLLGTVSQPVRSNKWKLDYTGSKAFKVGMSWEELINDQARTLSRLGGVQMTLFANNPSPLQIYYGVEQGDVNGTRKTAHRYWLKYDQRPGPNQLFSLFAGNLSWQHSRPDDQKLQNWSVKLEYQLKF